jgi:DNA-binding PadR family transcriptional regulator
MSTRIKGRTLGVPRGLLRFLVLKMLSEKPMSGAEIIHEIEKQTKSWKPSPGSIYPLLSRMQKRGFTEELPRDELGFKRYCFTEEGKQFLKQQIEVAKDFMDKIAFLLPMLVGGLNFEKGNKKVLLSKESAIKMAILFVFLRKNLDNLTEEDSKELTEILEESSAKIEKIVQRVKNQKEDRLHKK